MSPIKIASFAAVFCAIMAPASVRAQDGVPIWIGDFAVNDAILGSAINSASKSKSGSPRQKQKQKQVAARASYASLSFTSSPTRRRENLKLFVEHMRRSTPEGAEEMAATFASGDYIKSKR